jgi:hypothetical protein
MMSALKAFESFGTLIWCAKEFRDAETVTGVRAAGKRG